MKLKFDQIIVIDVESTCWESINSAQISEIIEIGICPIDLKTKELLIPTNIIVKPKLPISEFCTRLTSITQDFVNQGISFQEACFLLESEYKTKRYVWASYGNYDRHQFKRQCEREKVNYPFSDDHINVKTLFAVTYSLTKGIGMEKALELLKMPLEGTHHRGIDDAKNIAKILQSILFGDLKLKL